MKTEIKKASEAILGLLKFIDSPVSLPEIIEILREEDKDCRIIKLAKLKEKANNRSKNTIL